MRRVVEERYTVVKEEKRLRFVHRCDGCGLEREGLERGPGRSGSPPGWSCLECFPTEEQREELERSALPWPTFDFCRSCTVRMVEWVKGPGSGRAGTT